MKQESQAKENIDVAKTAITSSAQEITISDTANSFYIVRNGWCFWQIKVKSTDTGQHDIYTLPKPYWSGSNIYFEQEINSVRSDYRINGSTGVLSVRIRNQNTDEFFNGAYPVA